MAAFGDVAAKVAAEGSMLQQKTGISDAVLRQSTCLALSWKQLQPGEAEAIGQQLHQAVDLVEMDLRNNLLCDGGAIAIADGLRHACRKLLVVRLGGTPTTWCSCRR